MALRGLDEGTSEEEKVREFVEEDITTFRDSSVSSKLVPLYILIL